MMMENKMTAMKTLMEWMLDESEVIPVDPGDVYAKAKELLAMEKEQMGKFYNEGRDFAQYTHDEEYGGIEYWDREPLGFEEYYNETYGKQDN